jgi:hypothetical protein
MAKKMIILRGLPGSGKTSFAKFLKASFDTSDGGVVISEAFAADDYFYVDGEYRFDATKLGGAHGQCRSRVDHFLGRPTRAGEDRVAIVHNTTTTEKELKEYLEIADKHGAEVVSLIVENRHGNKSVHGVPDEAMEKMKARFSVKL